MLDFKERRPSGDQAAKIKAAFSAAWRPVKDVPDTDDVDHRYRLTLQHPEMRQRFLDACVREDFWTNIPDALIVVDREFRALNILHQLHRDGEL